MPEEPMPHEPIPPRRQVPVTTELLMAWAFRAMVALSVPAIGWGITSLLSKSDEVVSTVHSHDIKLEVLTIGNQMISQKLNDIHESIMDHEQRLRQLERPMGTGHQ